MIRRLWGLSWGVLSPWMGCGGYTAAVRPAPGEPRAGAAPAQGFPPLSTSSNRRWCRGKPRPLLILILCQGSASWAHPQYPEPSLPGTAGQPAAVSRFLIPRDKSRSLTRPEEEKSRALSREQQTRQRIPQLPARPGALQTPHLHHPGAAPAVLSLAWENHRCGVWGAERGRQWGGKERQGGLFGWETGGAEAQLSMRDEGCAGVFVPHQPGLPQTPSRTGLDRRSGAVAPWSQTSAPPAVAGCEGAFTRGQESTITSVPRQGMALGPPVPPARGRRPPPHGAGFSSTPSLLPQELPQIAGDSVGVLVPLTLRLLLLFIPFRSGLPAAARERRKPPLRHRSSGAAAPAGSPGSSIRVGPAGECQQQ